MRLLAKIFTFLGLICYAIGIYNIWLINNPQRLSFQSYSYASTTKQQDEVVPTRIKVDNLGIDLPIIPSRIIDNNWVTTDLGASYLESSPIPGDTGNSVIYAHNWASLFGNLVDIVPGDKVKIIFSDNSQKTFIIKYTSVISPETSSVLAPTEDRRITLYTCTGFLDSERFVAVAHLLDK